MVLLIEANNKSSPSSLSTTAYRQETTFNERAFLSTVKPGTCPEIANDVFGICIERCIGDGSCDGNEKCCSNGCGRVCMAPVAEGRNLISGSIIRSMLSV